MDRGTDVFCECPFKVINLRVGDGNSCRDYVCWGTSRLKQTKKILSWFSMGKYFWFLSLRSQSIFFKINGHFRFSINKTLDTTTHYDHQFNIFSGKLLETAVYAGHIPGSRQIWFPAMTTTNNKIIHFFLYILLELIPAIAFDTYFKYTGQKIRLLPIYRASHYNFGAMSYFIRNEWIFKDDNMRSVYEK